MVFGLDLNAAKKYVGELYSEELTPLSAKPLQNSLYRRLRSILNFYTHMPKFLEVVQYRLKDVPLDKQMEFKNYIEAVERDLPEFGRSGARFLNKIKTGFDMGYRPRDYEPFVEEKRHLDETIKRMISNYLKAKSILYSAIKSSPHFSEKEKIGLIGEIETLEEKVAKHLGVVGIILASVGLGSWLWVWSVLQQPLSISTAITASPTFTPLNIILSILIFAGLAYSFDSFRKEIKQQ